MSATTAALATGLAAAAVAALWGRRSAYPSTSRSSGGDSDDSSQKRIQRVRHVNDAKAAREGRPSPLGSRGWPRHIAFAGPQEFVLLPPSMEGAPSPPATLYLKAGPRETVYWDAGEVRAAIVTCGGLCPGLNTVIRETVMCLDSYGVKTIFGVDKGYRGFYSSPLIPLTPEAMQDVHLDGGTTLGSSRGGFELDKILGAVKKHKLNQLYVIGGDGTHRGALALVKGVQEAGLRVAVAAVPKTIDNDVPLIDKSFGFDTAVEQAVRVINSAYIEATAHKLGVGIVKLMGRHSGAIAMHASMACRLVNIVLIPEMEFECDNVCKLVLKRQQEGKQTVIVIAEGTNICNADLCSLGAAGGEDERDASGNVRMKDVGALLKDYIEAWFAMNSKSVNVKYLDPTYIIRSVPANPSDSILCSQLAYNAVHGVFAGFTGFTVGNINNVEVMLPVETVTTQPPRRVDTKSAAFVSLMLNTGQPQL